MSARRDARMRAMTERLRDIEAVADTGLARLSVEELLVELLDRVRDILRANTAVAGTTCSYCRPGGVRHHR